MSWKKDLGAWTAPKSKEDENQDAATSTNMLMERRQKATSQSQFFPRHLEGSAVKSANRLSGNSTFGSGMTPQRQSMNMNRSQLSTVADTGAAHVTPARRGGDLNNTSVVSRASQGLAGRAPVRGSQWVTVSGVTHKYITFTIAVLEGRFGKIEGHIWQGGNKNWFHVQFASSIHADQAVHKGGLLIAQGSFNNKAATVVRLSWCTDSNVVKVEDPTAPSDPSRMTATPSRMLPGNLSLDSSAIFGGNAASALTPPPPGGNNNTSLMNASSSFIDTAAPTRQQHLFKHVPTPAAGNLSLEDIHNPRYFRNLSARGAFERPEFREIKWWMSYTFWSTILFFAVLLGVFLSMKSVHEMLWEEDSVAGADHIYGSSLESVQYMDEHGVLRTATTSDLDFCNGEFCQ